MKIILIKTPNEIKQCFEAFQELRSHLKDEGQFVEQILLQQKEGYTLSAIFEDQQVSACIGYRVMNMVAWGKILYIDDLITRNIFRKKGYGGKLLDYVIKEAKAQNCDQVHLDSGITRHAAHRIYLKHGFQLTCHHMALSLTNKNILN